MIIFRRFNLLKRKSFLNNFFSSEINLSLSSSPANQARKKRVENGPGLKHFLLQNNQSLKADADCDEIISNKLAEHVNHCSSDEIHAERPLQKVYFEVHGCQMNLNDTEVALAILKQTGIYERTLEEKNADVILIMTCSIRENSEQKIWNKLREFRFLKTKRPEIRIGILGCMAERLKEKILDKEKLVDVICGPDSYRSLPSLLESSWKTGNLAMNVHLSLEETYADVSPIRINKNLKTAYVSIQRGCDNMCSFCIVPFVRGRERSRSISSIVNEIKHLSEIGIKEVTLLGQNVNSYRDMSEISHSSLAHSSTSLLSEGFKTIYKPKKGGKTFTELLEKVSQIDPEMRIRFTSPHPKDFPSDLLSLMKERHNICKTIHLPAQSGSSSCLERMRRGYTRDSYLNLVQKIRDLIPEVGFTSDFISGFCGETEEEHRETISLINMVKYDFCFMYPYSMREKTRAFHRLSDDVPAHVKSRRYAEMVDAFRQNAAQLNNSKIGQTHLVLIDIISKRSSDDFSGRNDKNNIVVFPKQELSILSSCGYLEEKKRELPKIGDYVACKILSATSQSLKAEPLYISKLSDFYKFSKNIRIN